MRVNTRGDRFIMSPANLAASLTLQHGVWAASQYFNKGYIQFLKVGFGGFIVPSTFRLQASWPQFLP